MRRLFIALGGWGLIILSCLPALARTSHELHGGNCVAYAREVTGIHLDGNAAMWWPHAEGRYDRGQRPAVGAILVFKPHGGMRVGHVAVVSRIVGPREVLVDQANWVRGRVTMAMSVIDASSANDWTSVKVLEPHSGTHGRENPTYGFIYPRALPGSTGEAVAEAPQERHQTTHAERAEHSTPHEDRRETVVANAAPRAEITTTAPDATRPKHHHHIAVDKDRHETVVADAPPRAQVTATAPDTTESKHHRHIAVDKDRHENTVAAAHPDAPSPAHHRHHKDAQPDVAAAHADTPPPAQLASDSPDHHHKHKAPDAKLAAVY